MRRRKSNTHLPKGMYLKHGAYYLVRDNKWTRLAPENDYPGALVKYAKTLEESGDTMPALIEKAHPYITKDKAPGTIKKYGQVKETLKQIMKDFRPEQVTPRDVSDIKMHYADRPNTANIILSYLRMTFDYAFEWQIVEQNPCLGIKRLPVKKRDRYLTDKELTAIKQHADDSLRAIIDIAYLTGQRISDILAIKLHDISEEGILFRQQKTKQRLMVTMTPELQQAIDTAKTLKRPVRGLTLFCTRKGGRPYSYNTVRTMWDRAVEKAGITERTTLHDIRAKAATDARKQGINATNLLGHTDARTTELYIRERDTIVTKPVTMARKPE